MVAFNQLPSNLRVPFVGVEFDNSRATQGAPLLAYRTLLVGQKLKSGSAPANSLQRVTSADAVATLCGRGSMLHRMAIAYFAVNQSTETWIGVLDDAPAAVIASGAFTISGTASADGSIIAYIGGQRVVAPVASGDSAAEMATSLATEIGIHASGSVTFAAAVAGTNPSVAGVQFVGTAGAVTPGAATYSIDTGDAAAASSFASQVNAHAVAGKIVRAKATSAVAAVRAIDSGPAGNAIALATTDVGKAAISGSTLTGATAQSDLAAHAAASAAVVNLFAQNGGAVANEMDLRLNYQDGESLPAGVTVTVTPMANGANNPALADLIASMGDTQYTTIANPYTDPTSLTALEAELERRFGPMVQADGLAVAAKNDTYSNVAALGESRNSSHSCIARVNESPTLPCEYAAQIIGQVAIEGSNDPALPLQTVTLPTVLAPQPEASRDTTLERNMLLFDGISTTSVAPGDVVQIERLITTYQKNAAGSPDESYLDATTMLTLMYLRYSFRTRFATKFARYKVADDGTPIAAGQKIITPKIAKAEAVAWFKDMQDLGLVEGLDQFKADLVVVRNPTNVNRLDFQLSPDLINPLIVVGALFQFLL